MANVPMVYPEKANRPSARKTDGQTEERRIRLSTTTVRALALPPGAVDKVFFDADLPGFGVRLRRGGSRTWLVQYAIAGKTRRIVLGSVAALDPGKARATAKDLLAAVRLGRDPAAEKAETRIKAAETLGALLPRFLQHQRTRLKPRSFEEVERHLLVHAAQLHSRPLQAIDRRAVAIRLAEIAETSGPAAANRVRASLSACFTWFVREGLVEANPVLNTNKAFENSARERLLGDDELRAIWTALCDDQYSAIVKLLILTGCRRDEIASLRWSEVDLDRALIRLDGARTKNRRSHEVPLAPPAFAILQEQPRRVEANGNQRDLIFGFGDRGWQDWSGSKRDLDARMTAGGTPVLDWRLHDFRRALSTAMHDRLGVQPHVVEAVLGHAGHRSGVAAVYNRATYLDEKTRALEAWAQYVLAAVEGHETNIVPLKR